MGESSQDFQKGVDELRSVAQQLPEPAAVEQFVRRVRTLYLLFKKWVTFPVTGAYEEFILLLANGEGTPGLEYWTGVGLAWYDADLRLSRTGSQVTAPKPSTLPGAVRGPDQPVSAVLPPLEVVRPNLDPVAPILNPDKPKLTLGGLDD